MYSVTYGGKPIYRSGNRELPAYGLHLSETENGVPEFSFQMPGGHPLSGKLEAGREEVAVYDSRDGTYSEENEIFRGKVVGIETDFQNEQRIECTGVFAYLEHSIQRPSEHKGETVSQFLAFLLGEHNKQVSLEERIYPGRVTVQGRVSGCVDYETTLECVGEKMLKEFGGRIQVRRLDGKNYLDYLDGYRNAGNQPIEFGRNLLEFSQNLDASEIYTVCIPLGGRLEESPIEGLEAYLTIESVNGGKVLSLAGKSAAELITAALNGYVVTSPDEVLIMDAPAKEGARKVWRWDQDGLGYSQTGCAGPYHAAITMDGEIVADFIKAGTLGAGRIGSGTMEGDVTAKNLTVAGGKISIETSGKEDPEDPIRLTHRKEGAGVNALEANAQNVRLGYTPGQTATEGKSDLTLTSKGLSISQKERTVNLGYDEVKRLQGIRFGSKDLMADGTSADIPVLSTEELNRMFSSNNCGGGNTMAVFSGGSQGVHVDGAAFADGAWCAAFHTAPEAGPFRVNYMVSYFG